jgi:hypothetical protein
MDVRACIPVPVDWQVLAAVSWTQHSNAHPALGYTSCNKYSCRQVEYLNNNNLQPIRLSAT